MKFLQRIVILLNFTPLTHVFRAIYSFGLGRMVAALGKHRAVRSIYGYGSFFDGRCLYGVSDIDLIVVIDEQYSRTDAVHHEVALIYNRVRQIFPFLQDWHEHVENVIFLSEIKAGFSLPESVRLRAKQGRVVLLHGTPDLESCAGNPVTVGEAIAEVNSLLRIVLMKGEIHTSNLLFWKKIFLKLMALADRLGLRVLAEEFLTRRELGFLSGHDVVLFIRKSNPDELFPLLHEFSCRMFQEVRQRERKRVIDRALLDGARPESVEEFSAGGNALPSKVARLISETGKAELRLAPSSLLGITPRLDYLPMEKPLQVIEFRGSSYKRLRAMARVLKAYGDEAESFLIQMQDLLLLMRKLPSHVDIVPLDPLIFANIHGGLDGGQERFEMPASIYEEQKAMAEQMFSALAGIYRENEGRIQKLPFPCIYSEDDLRVIQDALHRMRVFLLHADGVDIGSADVLVDFLGRKYPRCRPFLGDLLAYYRYLTGVSRRKEFGNNLYRCLLQFMAQLLSGAVEISIDERHKHLGLTVGIITRNRAADLQDALQSLSAQERPADEVLIVDNGSTDKTRSVVQSFRERLPLSYYFLEEASIPMARNLVIEKARHDIIAFTDDDCVLEPQWLEVVERGFLRAENVGIVGGWVRHEPDPEASIMIDTYYSIFHHNKS
jgi:predicted nucleotidyltransferase